MTNWHMIGLSQAADGWSDLLDSDKVVVGIK